MLCIYVYIYMHVLFYKVVREGLTVLYLEFYKFVLHSQSMDSIGTEIVLLSPTAQGLA